MMVDNIKKFIVKHDNLFISLLSIIIISGLAFRILILPSDELWNFNNIYKMYNGFTIYQDSNVIITPLFYVIGNLLFNILGANILVFRIYNLIIFSAFFLSIYILFKKLGMTKGKSAAYLCAIITLCKSMIVAGANYNILAVTFVIISIIIEVLRIQTLNSKANKIYKYDIYQGIIFFLIFMSKQNIIVFYLMGLLVSRFLLNSNKKEVIKSIFISGTTSALLLIVPVTAFIVQGNFIDFINYVFLGITEFGTTNIGHEIIPLLEGIIINGAVVIITVIAISKASEMNINK